MTEEAYTESDIGTQVEVNHFGITFTDEVIRRTLPDGQVIIGPRLRCAQVFAWFTMLPSMDAASEETEKMLDMIRKMGGGDK